jgi:PcaR/PcaU/PobR family beta-ketoadipate pathway transcriptional regulator
METERDLLRSLSRGLSLLSRMSESASPPTLTEISRQMNLSKTTVQRMTKTLQRLGYICYVPESKRFTLGTKALSLGFSVMRGLDLRKIALPFLRKTSIEVGESVNLAILEGTQIVYVERIKTEQLLNINVDVGSRFPLHCTSMGKAILAFMPKEQLDQLMNGMDFTPHTIHTIKSKMALMKELEQVRRRGFAVNDEELSIGLGSVAAPVRNFSGDVIAAVNIAVPLIRVSLKRLQSLLGRKVMETANNISSSLGFKQD